MISIQLNLTSETNPDIKNLYLINYLKNNNQPIIASNSNITDIFLPYYLFEKNGTQEILLNGKCNLSVFNNSIGTLNNAVKIPVNNIHQIGLKSVTFKTKKLTGYKNCIATVLRGNEIVLSSDNKQIMSKMDLQFNDNQIFAHVDDKLEIKITAINANGNEEILFIKKITVNDVVTRKHINFGGNNYIRKLKIETGTTSF